MELYENFTHISDYKQKTCSYSIAIKLVTLSRYIVVYHNKISYYYYGETEAINKNKLLFW